MSFKQVVLYVSHRRGAEKTAWECTRILTECGVVITAPAGYSDSVTLPAQIKVLPEEETIKNADAVIVIGGDGTILRAAHLAAKTGVPILGLNMGHLGFMCELEASECEKLREICKGHYQIDERMMLEVKVKRDGKEIFSTCALNDISIGHAQSNKTLELDISSDGQFISHFRADGVVLSTPTGSTAYSLSAGGPIIEPTLQSICLTPVCAHGLYTKSFVLEPHRHINVAVDTRHRGGVVTADNQEGFLIDTGDEINIYRAPLTTKLIRIKGRSVYEVIRDKLTYDNYFEN